MAGALENTYNPGIMPFVADLGTWPRVGLRIEGNLVSAEVDEWVKLTTEDLPGRGEPYVVVIDLLDASTPSVEFIRKQAAAQRRARDAIATHCQGIAFVIVSPMVRGALKAILHIQPLPSPQLVSSSLEEAHQWAARQLEGA